MTPCSPGDPFDEDETQKVQIPTVENVARGAVDRMTLCILACDQVDDHTLRLLSCRNADGKSNLRLLLDTIVWTGTLEGGTVPRRKRQFE